MYRYNWTYLSYMLININYEYQISWKSGGRLAVILCTSLREKWIIYKVLTSKCRFNVNRNNERRSCCKTLPLMYITYSVRFKVNLHAGLMGINKPIKFITSRPLPSDSTAPPTDASARLYLTAFLYNNQLLLIIEWRVRAKTWSVFFFIFCSFFTCTRTRPISKIKMIVS